MSKTVNAIITEVDGVRYDTFFNDISQRLEAKVIGGGAENIVIPATIEYEGITFSVTQIQKRAFYGRTDVTSIIMPECINTIEGEAFSGCTGLTSIEIPKQIRKIDYRTFNNCYHLKSVLLPEELDEIGFYAFSNCRALSDLIIPSSVTVIRDYAFVFCSSLTSITFPEKLTDIGESAFYGCEELLSIVVPNSVTYIGKEAFDGTVWLEKQPMGIIYVGKVAYKYKGEIPENTEIEIKEGTIGISTNAFTNLSGLNKVTIPKSVIEIATSAFNSCNNLSTVVLNCNSVVSRNLQNIGETVKLFSMGGLFGNQVKEYILGEDIDAIGSYCFANCSDLLCVVIPNTVIIINNNAFEGCKNLSNIILSDNLTNIGWAAFNGCENLRSITVPPSMTSIDNGAFTGLSGLESITLPNSIKTIGYEAFSGCINLSSIAIPTSVTSIGREAFSGCTSLESITMPDNLTIIEYGTFCRCNSLTNINIPKNVTEIGGHAFSETKLSSIIIPSSVSFFGGYAFYNCVELHDVYYYNNSLPSASNSIFLDSNYNSATLHVPSSTIELYKETTPWKDFGSIIKLPEIIYMVDGKVYKSVLIMIGNPIKPIEYLQKEGYIFSGWSEMPETMPAHDVIVTGTFFKKGDTNGDDIVNAADIVEVVNYIMGNPSDIFNIIAADMNSDGVVDGTDIKLIMNVILAVN